VISRKTVRRAELLLAILDKQSGRSASGAEMKSCPHTLQLMGANKTLPHFPRAHTGPDLVCRLPVITEHSVLMCCSMRTLGS